jgi:small subunit ribosomal protein S3
MGQKVNPIGLRTGVNKDWNSKWYASKKDFATFLNRDVLIRKHLSKVLKDAAVSNVVIERTAKKTEVIIYTAKPGVIIGHGGEEIEKLKKDLSKLTTENVQISIMEIKNPDLSAQIVADNIARQIENRASFRRSMKQAMSRAMKAGAKGIKTKVSGRLDGAEIARSESYHEGSIPLQTLRADIDYGTATANTTFGAIGVKCWIYKGEVLGKNPLEGGNK